MKGKNSFVKRQLLSFLTFHLISSLQLFFFWEGYGFDIEVIQNLELGHWSSVAKFQQEEA